MRIVQINCVYGKGSTGKITEDLHNSLLEQGIDSIVLYGRGQKSNDPRVIKVCSEFYAHVNKVRGKLTGILYGGCLFSTNNIIRKIKKIKPDVVHLQCINGDFVNIYRLVNWLKKNNIKTVLTLHAEFMHTANCGHAFDCEKWKTGCNHCPVYKTDLRTFVDGSKKSWEKMFKAFDGFNNLIITSVSPWLMERAKLSPFFKDKKHFVTMNGLDTDIFHYYDTKDLREKMGLVDKKIIFHASPNFNDDPNHIKGGRYIIELAEELKDVTFLIAGPYPEGLQVPENMILLGLIKDQSELAKYYSMADLTVIASKRETFSMIVAESLCCGTMVVGFKAGGPESVSIVEYSEFVDYGDSKNLLRLCQFQLSKCYQKQEISRESMRKYNKSEMANIMCKLYKRLFDNE